MTVQATNAETHYDVIIVGGRPAGASLAARLGQQALRVLILERAEFPSAPAVSTPFFWSHGMKLLDEIGADEAQYARHTPKIRRNVLQYRDYFHTFIPVLDRDERDYMYVVERERFDTHLWRHLERFGSVTARDKTSVTDLLRDEAGKVIGVKARSSEQAEVRFTAELVVGADGRFSLVARKAGAEVKEQRSDLDTTIYYAWWEDVAPYDDSGETMGHIYSPADGYTFVFMPSADGRTSVVAQGRSDLYEPAQGRAQERYLELLQANPPVWRRLLKAKQVTKLSGMKRMGNLYRQAGGAGWVLVGDAIHQKDSLDAQGIYDALLEAKLLSQAIASFQQGGKSWPDALASYEQAVWDETHDMFNATLERVQRELYASPPPPVAKTILRWMLTDPEYVNRFALLLIREIEPATWAPPSLLVKALLKGMAGDLKRLITRAPNPTAVPPLHYWETKVKESLVV